MTAVFEGNGSAATTSRSRTDARVGGNADERSAARSILTTLGTALAALVAVAFPVFAHTVHPAAGILSTIVLACALYAISPGAALTAVLFGALFQNLFVSLASPQITSGTDFNLVRGYNFQMLAVVWGLSWLEYLSTWRRDRVLTNRLMLWTSATLAVIFAYTMLGALEGPQSAIIYLRNIASALLMFQAALVISRLHVFRLDGVLALAALLLVVLGYVELLYRDDWLRWMNGYDFWRLSRADEIAAGIWDLQAKELGQVVLGLQDSFKITLFNTPLLADLGIRVERVFGPNMHPISYAYALAFFVIYTAYTRRFVLAVLLLPLLVIANAKGAVIMVVLSGIAFVVSRLFGMRFAFFSLFAMLCVYVAAGIVLGLRIGDFHVLGLMGGIYNFVEYPIGHGIGIGGNLTTNFATLDWSDFQAAGRTPVAVESSIGVLLYQMGVGALVVSACYVWLAWRTTLIASASGNALHAAVGFAVLIILFNGFFQEEALFSPLGIGILLTLAGVIHGNALRQVEA